MKSARRRLLQGALAATALPAWAAAPALAPGSDGRKVLRLAFSAAETSFDPARISDLYSRTVTSHIFEALYAYDPLARPVKIKPLTAAGPPEVSADFRIWTVRIRPGIYFADDPAFQGKKRELVAQDYVYALQRTVDPANISPIEASILDLKVLGLEAARDEAKVRRRFDYDRPVEGLKALDRHTLRFTLEESRPRLLEALAASDLLGGVAREVVEFYGGAIAEHPVGTGPFRLKSWRRSSRIVLERNPQYREVLYDAEPAADDADGQALLARFKGRRLPMVDEVQVSIIDEDQPRWLAFMGRELDALAGATGALPGIVITQAAPGGKLAPLLARRGVQLQRQINPEAVITYFNMDDPVVGGNAPDRVALRRAISLCYDNEREIRLIRRGQAVPAQSQIVPHVSGYDPRFKSEMSDHDPARAKALLDLYGYIDRDGDGFRELPDGRPLVLEMATEPEQIYRQFNELWRKCLEAVGLRVKFNPAQWPENMKAANAGKLMMWGLGSYAASPDGQDNLGRLYGPQAGNENLARFKHAGFDRIYERMRLLPDGPERDALFHEAKRIALAYMPYKVHVHRIANDVLHPWVVGFRRPLFWNEWWHLVDLDQQARQRYDHA